MPSDDRINRLRELLCGETAVIYSPVARMYLTGFEAEDGLLVITPERALLSMDSRYIEAAKKADTGCEVLGTGKSFFETAAVKTALTETEISFADFAYLEKLMPEARLEPSKRLSDIISGMRAVKDADEIGFIRAAQEITDAAFSHILGYIRDGVSESEVALELDFFMRRSGAQGSAFETIVLSGTHGSMPHGVPSNEPLKRGALITMDFGARYHGYCSDMTRTVSLGEPDSFSADIYAVVLEAQKAAIAAIAAGVEESVPDLAARGIIADAGFGEYFGHATGHGVGIEIHENPRLAPRSRKALRSGNVVTVEPGIYVPGRAGVRIEDFGVVTENGFTDLTNSQKELIKL